jgi:hypothetical protein
MGSETGTELTMAEERDCPCRSRAGPAEDRPESRRAAQPRGIDLDRLVWDQEYRDEVRVYLRTGTDEG